MAEIYTPDVTVIREALLKVLPGNTHRTFAHKAEAPWLVWDVDGAGASIRADNRTDSQALGGTVDLFTRTPDDLTLFHQVQDALDGVPGCAWYLESIQYEPDTGLTHYEWRWEVA